MAEKLVRPMIIKKRVIRLSAALYMLSFPALAMKPADSEGQANKGLARPHVTSANSSDPVPPAPAPSQSRVRQCWDKCCSFCCLTPDEEEAWELYEARMEAGVRNNRTIEGKLALKLMQADRT